MVAKSLKSNFLHFFISRTTKDRKNNISQKIENCKNSDNFE
jgi:hypothetical protein